MDNNQIVMIDYGAGNIRSVQKAFEHIGAQITLTDDPQVVLKAPKLVLPGVGAFGAGIDALRVKNLDTAVINAANKGTPLLGICLGMQFLFDQSDEMGLHEGLGLIPGSVTRFNMSTMVNANNGQNDTSLPGSYTIPTTSTMVLKVPHMGWNQIEQRRPHALLDNVPDRSYAYFVHSYFCLTDDEQDVLARTEYGHPFASCVARDNIFGIQFHPEKSQQIGLQILKNFVML